MLSDLCGHCESLPLIVGVFFCVFFFMNNALAVTSRSPAARAVSAASKHQICPELGPLGQMRKSPACPRLSLTRHVEESLLLSSWLCGRRYNSLVRRMFLRPGDSMHMCEWDEVLMLLCTLLRSLQPFCLRSSDHREGTGADISHNLKP